MTSQFLEQLKEQVSAIHGHATPGMKAYVEETGHPFPMTPQQLAKPQSHREEVDWFINVGERLALERDTITPEEFREVLGLLPDVFPGITRDLDNYVGDLENQKDAAYLERNQLVAFLSKLYPSGLAKTAIEGWSEDWHNCVYVDTPMGQCSWHFHTSQAHLFEHLGPYMKPWDGHTTEEKYDRLSRYPAKLLFTTPKGIVLESICTGETQDKLAKLVDGSLGKVVTSSLPVRIKQLPEGMNVLMVSAPGIDPEELETLLDHIREAQRDPDYVTITNYHVEISGHMPKEEE